MLPIPSFIVSLAGALAASLFAPAPGAVPPPSPLLAETVYNLNRVKILQSNTPSLRPGSVYDVATYFESLVRAPMPGYNYEFIDSGLGATEPLYPMMQKGSQASYAQLIPAALWDTSRHIDHRSSLTTPEGCKVDSAYLLRHISEYPDTMFVKERAQGYTRVVLRLEHYTKLRADAECGRHVAHDPDPNFDPMAFMWDHRGAMTFADFPQDQLHRFEAKLSVNFPIIEERDPKRGRFDLADLNANSLWYYPDGHAFDYGIDTPRPQPNLTAFALPRHMVVEADGALQDALPLSALISERDYATVLAMLNGAPEPGFDPASEPGGDTLRLADVTPTNVYTSGLTIEPIRDVVADVSERAHFKLVGMTLKPAEAQLDAAWAGERIVPQVRFTYQMMDPAHPERPVEQMFLHLKWDAIDRFADDATRETQRRDFLARLDALTIAREAGDPAAADAATRAFVTNVTSARPVHTVSWGSSLTGTWIFGNLEHDAASGGLKAIRTVRHGIDYGYYSSVYDTDQLRAEIAATTGARHDELKAVLESLTVDTFRDPKREDVHALRFDTVSCAQCHQMSGRDGIHMSFNDGINSRITTPTIVSEYFFHEADAQLRGDMEKWLAAR